MAALADIPRDLGMTVEVSVHSYYARGGDLQADTDGYNLAEIVEVLDAHICPLCRALDGKILKKGTPEWTAYSGPSHINCRRVLSYIKDTEIDPATGRAVEPDDLHARVPHLDALVGKHGHFVTRPQDYSQLRIPARPEGRDFVFLRGAGGEPGEVVWRDGLSQAALEDTLAVAGRNLLEAFGAGHISARLLETSATNLAYHASLRAVASDWPRLVSAHAGDWPQLGEIDSIGLRALGGAAADDPAASAALTTIGGSRTLVVYSPSVEYQGKAVHDVWVTYDLESGRLLSIERPLDPARLWDALSDKVVLRGAERLSGGGL